jgi:hypothetical protein
VPQDKAENPALNPQRVARAFGVAAATCALPLLTSCARVNIDPEGPFKVDIGVLKKK